MKLRNASSETVVDFHTGRVAEPDAVIEVPDAWADAYESHPIWDPVPDPTVALQSKPAGRPATNPTEEVSQ